ncbi:MAG TPA: dihydroorotase, partial [Thermoleophilia bacterium]|nr:dihydroorotase [Thermoleophilia bacterium]
MTVRVWSKGGAGADLVVRGARVVDPQAKLDKVCDVLVKRGRIVAVGQSIEAPEKTRVVAGAGRLLLPGFVDLHAHLRTPGHEDEEDLTTGSAAAAAGGYVALFSMANTEPVIDSAPVLDGLAQQATGEASVPTGFFAS